MFLYSVDRLIAVVPEKTGNVPFRERTVETVDGQKEVRGKWSHTVVGLQQIKLKPLIC